MGRRAVDKNAIYDLMGVVREEKSKITEEERKQALRDSVKISSVPEDYMYVSTKRETKPSPSNFVMRWVDSRNGYKGVLTSSGRTFLP